MKNAPDIIDEVKQDISSERTMNLIRNYGKYILSAIVLFIIAFSIYVYLNNRDIDNHKKFAEEYQTLFLNSPPSIDKQKPIEKYIKKVENNIFEYLATFHYSNLLANNKQENKAIEMLLSISQKGRFSEMSNLALVQASEIIIERAAPSHRDQVIHLLSSRVEKNDNKTPHFYIMQIMLVQLMIEKGDLLSAKETLKKMDNNTNLPPNIKLLRSMLSNTIFTKKNE